ncbi:MAG: serine hydrolase domain-containing protein, partial [Dokdonella sp.]
MIHDRSRRRLAGGLSLVLAAMLAASPAPAAEGVAAGFDASFNAVLDDAGVPGGAWAIIDNSELLDAGAHGVRALDDPRAVGTSTVFRIASLSKTFAAGLAAILVDDGVLRWDEPLGAFAPQLRLKNDAQRGLQLQHLLGQSTGLVPNAFDNLVDDGRRTMIMPAVDIAAIVEAGSRDGEDD